MIKACALSLSLFPPLVWFVIKAAEMVELRERNKSMKDELFRLSQRYSRRMSMVKKDIIHFFFQIL